MSVQTTKGPSVAHTQNGHASQIYLEQSEDPMVAILAAFYAIPDEYHLDLFDEIREAAASHDLRRLLDSISDWAATAQLYANPDLAADLAEAVGNRREAADWLTG